VYIVIMATSFLKKIIQASEDLETLVYVNSKSFDLALERWTIDLAKELQNTTERFNKDNFKVSAGMIDLNERRLEENNKDFLENLHDFVDVVEQLLAQKAYQYVKFCEKFGQPKTLEKQWELADKASEYLSKLDLALSLVRKFSGSRLENIEKLKLTSLSKYKDLFSRIRLFSILDRKKVIALLKEKSEI
jgi:hypothetical protein